MKEEFFDCSFFVGDIVSGVGFWLFWLWLPGPGPNGLISGSQPEFPDTWESKTRFARVQNAIFESESFIFLDVRFFSKELRFMKACRCYYSKEHYPAKSFQLTLPI